MPHMQTTRHDIYFGKSHLLLPVIPAPENKSEFIIAVDRLRSVASWACKFVED